MSKSRIPAVLFAVSLLSTAAFAAPASSPAADFVPAGAVEPLDDAAMKGMASIAASSLGAHVAFLASPALEGRGLGERGFEAAAEYAAAQLKLAGIAPFGTAGEEGSYFQAVPVRRLTGISGELEIEKRDGGQRARRKFASGVDCVVSAAAPQAIEAAIVFAGHGIREPKLGRDDFAGLDVRGKIVLIVAGVPPGDEWTKPELATRYAAEDMDDRFVAKLETAKQLGAAAVLAIEGEELETSVAARARKVERGFRAYDETSGAPPLIQVSRTVGRAILGEAFDAAMSGVKPRTGATGASAVLQIAVKEEAIVSRNVIGIIPGSDPKLRDEALVIGAHLDHLGRSGDVIYFGADDDASGVAGLIEIAKAFAASPVKPKRTVIFCFWTGEEEGKFGSGYYVNNPRWPLAKTAAYLNLDMIGHPWLREEIRKLVTDVALPDAENYLAGVKAEEFMEVGIPRDLPALETAVRQSARANGFPLHLDWTDGKHGGSDYRDFARAGVPFLRFFGNFFAAYHEPGDTAEALDPEQVQRVARFAFAAAWKMANP
ncbi:MAG: M20/M25/M40 family metallo-hydrolase [Thermoanaerobaculia bacterium]|jgi:hypothetical protein